MGGFFKNTWSESSLRQCFQREPDLCTATLFNRTRNIQSNCCKYHHCFRHNVLLNKPHSVSIDDIFEKPDSLIIRSGFTNFVADKPVTERKNKYIAQRINRSRSLLQPLSGQEKSATCQLPPVSIALPNFLTIRPSSTSSKQSRKK